MPAERRGLQNGVPDLLNAVDSAIEAIVCF
jgi:hypothetical protein